MSKLAILGGSPVRKGLFPAYNPIGREEAAAVARVMESGNLSQYIGAWHQDFMGGPVVQEFERRWAGLLNCRHAFAVNSATSGLFAAMGACDIGPGDEVIVSPYTMSASAIAPAVYGAVPVFADVSKKDFCLDAKCVEERVTKRTKAIIVVHIFGGSADMIGILRVARKHGLKVIEDCAQAPLATYREQYVGTIGDIGVFSLNYHKHIHTGEGGVITTNDSEIAQRLALIRNHGEVAVEGMSRTDLSALVGFNYRFTEIGAAIGIAQLKKLKRLLRERDRNVEFLKRGMSGLPLFNIPVERKNCRHVHYVQPLLFDCEAVIIHRDTFVDAIKAELPSAEMRKKIPLISAGYVKPLYLQPFYQKQTARCSYNCPRYKGVVEYRRGICPVVEDLHFNRLITHEFIRPGMKRSDLQDVLNAFEKVCCNVDEVHRYERRVRGLRK